MAVEKIHLSIDPDLLMAAQLRDKHNRSGAITSALSRYFDLMRWYRRELAGLFTAAECGLMIDALNGVWLGDDINIRLLGANIEDAIQMDRLDQKWEVDGQVLNQKLAGLTVAHLYTIADAIARWWGGEYSGSKEYGDLFR